LATKRTLLGIPYFPFFLFLFFFASLLIVKANILNAPYHWDVMGYVIPSADAFYESWHLSSLTGLSGHPPLFFIVLALAWKLFGQSLVVSHVLVLIFGALGLTVLFVLTENLFTWKEAAAAVLLLFFNQLFFAQVGMVYLSVPLMCLALFTVYFYRRQKNLLFVVSAAAMLLVKETAAFFLLAIILFDVVRSLSGRIYWKALVKKSLILSLPLVSLILWYGYHWLKAGWAVNTKLLVNKARVLPLFLDNILKHLIYDRSGENVNRASWIVFFAVIVYIILQIVKRKSMKVEWLFLLIIVINILFFSYSDDLPRYFLVFYPFYFILGARAFVILSGFAGNQKNMALFLLLLAVILLSVFNYTGERFADGWRLESNMEYLDLVRVSQSTAEFIENQYPDYRLITTFPLNFAFSYPTYGYVSRPLSVIPMQMFDNFENVLVIRTFQSNYLFFSRFLQSQRTRLKKIAEFSRNGKRMEVYIKRKREGA